MTQLIAPVLLAWLSPLKGRRQISVTINAPVMLQTCFNFHDVALQTRSTPNRLSQTCFPIVLPLSGHCVMYLIPQGQRAKLFLLFKRKIAFLITLNLPGISSLALRKGCHSEHPSPPQAVGPTPDFHQQFPAICHGVTGQGGSPGLLLPVVPAQSCSSPRTSAAIVSLGRNAVLHREGVHRAAETEMVLSGSMNPAQGQGSGASGGPGFSQ